MYSYFSRIDGKAMNSRIYSRSIYCCRTLHGTRLAINSFPTNLIEQTLGRFLCLSSFFVHKFIKVDVLFPLTMQWQSDGNKFGSAVRIYLQVGFRSVHRKPQENRAIRLHYGHGAQIIPDRYTYGPKDSPEVCLFCKQTSLRSIRFVFNSMNKHLSFSYVESTLTN